MSRYQDILYNTEESQDRNCDKDAFLPRCHQYMDVMGEAGWERGPTGKQEVGHRSNKPISSNALYVF
jgi:hypothetical protein